MSEPSPVSADVPPLCPSQQRAYGAVLDGWNAGSLFHIGAREGMGASTVLRSLQRKVGGAFLTARDFFDAVASRHPLAIEEAVTEVLLSALRSNAVVCVDDWHLVYELAQGGCRSYPRSGWINTPLTAVCAYAESAGKKLIMGGGHAIGSSFDARAYAFWIGKFEPEDYSQLIASFLDAESATKIDVGKVHRFAPNLSAHQLRAACVWLRTDEPPGSVTTDRLLDYLRSRRLASNVELDEVAQVDFRDLKGVDDVIRELETHVVLPLENDEMARQFGLEPKRGVLLVGPPGTGKTTIGRALAHRLKGKFLLIDGTAISGTAQFYDRISRVFHAAKENAPSVVFIDDSDVIFESGQEHGLYRYLLTALDGLESKSASRVCVMMTAMDVGNLPPALLRSGRIELWLEMRPPDAQARAEILAAGVARLPRECADLAIDRVVERTEGFTGADLRRTLDDGKALLAFDRARGVDGRPFVEYVLVAARGVLENRRRYEEAESRARVRRPVRPSWFGLPFDPSAMAGEFDTDE